MHCQADHTVAGHPFPPPSATPPGPVTLWAEQTRPTPNRLAYSILNPSHAFEPGYKDELILSGTLSRMGDYSQAVTVRQLSGLVAFLGSLKSLKRFRGRSHCENATDAHH